MRLCQCLGGCLSASLPHCLTASKDPGARTIKCRFGTSGIPPQNPEPHIYSTVFRASTTDSMSTHLPLRLCRPLHRQYVASLSSVRPFSSSRVALARGSQSKINPIYPVIARTATRHRYGRATSSLEEEQLVQEQNLPDDLGLVPGNSFALGKHIRMADADASQVHSFTHHCFH